LPRFAADQQLHSLPHAKGGSSEAPASHRSLDSPAQITVQALLFLRTRFYTQDRETHIRNFLVFKSELANNPTRNNDSDKDSE